MPILKDPSIKKTKYGDIASYIGKYNGRVCEIPADLKEHNGKVAVIFFDNLEKKLVDKKKLTIITVIKKELKDAKYTI